MKYLTFLVFFAGAILSAYGSSALLSPQDFGGNQTDEQGSYLRVESDPATLSSVFDTRMTEVKPRQMLLLKGTFRLQVLSPLLKPCAPFTVYAYWFNAKRRPLSPERRTWLMNMSEQPKWKEFKKSFQVPEGAAFFKIHMGAWRAHTRVDCRDFQVIEMLPDASAQASSPDWKKLPGKQFFSKLSPQGTEEQNGLRSRIELGGVWGFLPRWDRPEQKAKWTTLQVPGAWGTVRGFTQPKEWKNLLSAVYCRTFSVPAEWKGQRILLRFGAVLCRARVYIDGRPAGEHLGGVTPFALDVTELAAPGTHTLTVEVDGPLKAGNIQGKYLVMSQYGLGYTAKHWRGGIWQSVSLEKKPTVSIEQPYVKTSVEREELAVELSLKNRTGRAFSGTLSVRVANSTNQNADTLAAFPEQPIHLAASSQEIQFAPLTWRNAPFWSPENPRLLYLIMELYDSEKRLVDRDIVRFGFREFKVKGRDFYLNGKIRRLRGDTIEFLTPFAYMNRRSLTMMFRHMRDDLHLNTIRCSSIPPAFLLDVADEEGMLIDAQSALIGGGHQFGHYLFPGLHSQMMKNLNREFSEWVLRDRNHPSLVIWNLENEFYSCGGDQTVHITKELESTVRKLDNTRVVTRAGSGFFDGASDELINIHGYDAPSSRILIRYQEKYSKKPFANQEFWGNGGPQKIFGEKSYWSFANALQGYGCFFKEFIEYMRVRRAAAIYPLRIAYYAFQPFCYPSTLTCHWPKEASDEPRPKKFTARIPLGTFPFNPGCFSDLPSAVPHPSIVRQVETAFRPLHIMLRQVGESAWAGKEYKNNAVLVNDTPEERNIRFSVDMSIPGKTPVCRVFEEIRLSPGEIRELPFALDMPPCTLSTPGTLTLKLLEPDGKLISQNSFELTLYPKAELRTKGKSIAVIGSSEQRKQYNDAGLPCVAFRPADLKNYDLVIIAQNADWHPLLKIAEKLRQYVEHGGKLWVMAQTAIPSGILPGRINMEAVPVYFKRAYTNAPAGFPKTYLRKNTYLHANDPAHPIWRNFPGGKLSLWNNAEQTVTTGAELNLSSIQGPCRELTHTGDKNSSGLLEYFHGRGILFTGPVDIEGNLQREPQADHLFLNIADYLLTAEKRPSRRVIVCGREAARLAQACAVESRPVSSIGEIQPAEKLIVLSPDAMTPKNAHDLRAHLTNGADVLAFYSAETEAFLKEFGIDQEKAAYRCIIFPNGKPHWLSGFSSFSLLSPRALIYPVALRLPENGSGRELARFISVQAGWEYPYPEDGATPDAGRSAIVEYRLGKGRLLLVPWGALKNAGIMERALFRNFMTGLDGKFLPEVTGEVPVVRIIQAGEVKIDGNLEEWTYDRTVEELVPFRHAVPIPIAARVSELLGTPPTGNRDCSGIVFLMYDRNYLYFAANIVDDKLVFNQVPGSLYRADSLDFFVNSLQAQVSLWNGKPVCLLSRLSKEEKDQIQIVLKKDPQAGSGRDMHLLGNGSASVAGAPGYVIEGRIPWKCLTADGKVPSRFRFSAAINDCDHPEKNNRDRQLRYPMGFCWGDNSTMAEAVIEK